jgi:hypothetical protein
VANSFLALSKSVLYKIREMYQQKKEENCALLSLKEFANSRGFGAKVAKNLFTLSSEKLTN